METRKSRRVQVGENLFIGGDAPVVVQSMLNAPQGDIEANVQQARELSAAGCQLIRLSVTHHTDIDTIRALKEAVKVPLVADIQMNYELALESIDAGIDKIRINPRYIGGPDKVREVADKCKEHHIPIRVGVNSGSVEKELLKKYGGVTPEAMAESAMNSVRILENADFHDIVISIKSSDIRTMIAAYRIVAKECDYPLHLGVTEAGTEKMGRIKSAIGIGSLLADGIGDTIRVSLADEPVKEIDAAFDILKALDLVPDAPQLVACPTCGRTQIDLIGIANEVEERLKDVHKPIRVAVMGCPVNGPGEASNADIGIAGGNGVGLLFKKGEIIKKVPEEELVDELFREIERL
ncbi:MAG: flavodoxin-dependent (E)-4-hydroxy-3-methylbut-2-enyl-diphosphate synthase [Acutalibacteraceae bacterium]|nr:flavodoxin-dependent (E)-4-hydroxy-3-methylbut-2-enyl-diphosphate synthase [Acutalibacteraceae bacterium]